METYNTPSDPVEQVCMDLDPSGDWDVQQCPLAPKSESKTR